MLNVSKGLDTLPNLAANTARFFKVHQIILRCYKLKQCFLYAIKSMKSKIRLE